MAAQTLPGDGELQAVRRPTGRDVAVVVRARLEQKRNGVTARSVHGPPAVDEGRLVEQTAAGDRDAFRQLIERHAGRLLAVAKRILNDEAEAEDVVQETLLKLWQSAAELESGPAGIGGWLRQVCRNGSIDRLRRRKPTTEIGDISEVAEPALALQAVDDGDVRDRVNHALAQLPERQRLALALFHYEGMSLAETAEAIAVSAEAVESLLARARRKLRKELEQDWRQLLED